MRKLLGEMYLQFKSLFCVLLFPGALFFFSPVIIHAQNITLTTQSEVDAFNHTSISGNLLIKGQTTTSITNLDGLSELTSVGGFVIIEDNASLTNVWGLGSLTTVGETLDFERNNSLPNLTGLSSLTSIGNALLFFNNTALTNIDALSNLTNLDGGLNLTGNTALTNIDGLSNLPSIGGFLHIQGNSALTNVDGLSGIPGVAGQMRIENNNNLLNLDGLSSVTHVFGDINIESNPKLTTIALSSLQGVSGRFEIHSNNKLATIDLSKLVVVDGIFAISFNPLLTAFDLSKLTTVVGHFTISSNPMLTDINSLTSLTTVGLNFGISFNNLITNLDGLINLNSVGLDLGISHNAALTDFCGLHDLFASGSIGRNVDISNNGANTVIFTPSDVTVNTDPGVCTAVVPTASIPDPISGCLPTITELHTNFPAGNIFPGGVTTITWTATDGAGNTVSGVQNITVVDNQAPVITSCPTNLTVSCASDVPAANVNLVTATDNCSVTVTHVGDNISNQTCANRFTVTRTYQATDGAGNTAQCSQVITVNDNTPPQINSLSPSQTILWPPNHTMRDITVNYTVTDNCTTNATTTVSVTSNEPVNGTADGDTDPDWIVVDNHHVKLRAERAANGTGRIYTITVTTTDGCNAPVSATTQVEVVHNITGPHSGHPFIVGSTVNFSGEFWDKPTNKHTSKWLIDGSTSVKGIITEPTTNKNGKATGSYKFTSPGVYKLQMNITDQNNVTSYANTNGDIEEIVVIYDPNGGYTYGGGWFESQAGALVADPSATGKASYGFTVNYFKNSTYPKGETQFEFKVGSLEFNALNFDYLVINGAKAQIKGSGKITGDQSGYGFIMTVTDGELDGTGVDKIRMKIYNKNNGRVVYDNLPGESDATDPVTAVASNSSVVIYSTSNLLTKAEVEKENISVYGKLQVKAFPNPSPGNFSVIISSSNLNEPVMMEIADMYGRIIEKRNVAANRILTLGEKYSTGVYVVTVTQGITRKQIRLVKTAAKAF